MTLRRGNLFLDLKICKRMRRMAYVSWVSVLQDMTKSAEMWSAIWNTNGGSKGKGSFMPSLLASTIPSALLVCYEID